MSKLGVNISEDDIDGYRQSSGEEWIQKQEKKRTPRRTSQRLRKKPRISVDAADSSSSSGDEKRKKKSRTPNKMSRKSYTVGMNIVNTNFLPGGFVVHKRDVQVGDSSKPPCLWRIDGKALLQKYEPFDEQGKTLHRNTSVYTGWSPLDKDLYAPVNVRVQWHTSQQMTVELDWETLKNATIDSD